MTYAHLWMAMAATLAPPALGDATREQPAIEYGCNDIVIVGRVNNVEGSYKRVETGNDIIGAGRITAQVDVKRVLAGHEARKKLRAEYVAHTYLVEDRDFVLVLKPSSYGSYTVLDFILSDTNAEPRLLSTCS